MENFSYVKINNRRQMAKKKKVFHDEAHFFMLLASKLCFATTVVVTAYYVILSHEAATSFAICRIYPCQQKEQFSFIFILIIDHFLCRRTWKSLRDAC